MLYIIQVELLEAPFFLEGYISKEVFYLFLGAIISFVLSHIGKSKDNFFKRFELLEELKKIDIEFLGKSKSLLYNLKMNDKKSFSQNLLEYANIESNIRSSSLRCLNPLLRSELILKYEYVSKLCNDFYHGRLSKNFDDKVSLKLIEKMCLNSVGIIKASQSRFFIIGIAKQLFRLFKHKRNFGINIKKLIKDVQSIDL